MEYKIVQEQDLEKVKYLWAYCFESHQPFFDWYFREYYQRGNTLGAYQEGNLLANLQLIPYDIFLRGKELKTSYIVGVATYPEGRRGGIVRGLLEEALKEMRKREQYISLLMPFKAVFYHPYDWQFCYHHLKYTLPLEELKKLAQSWGELKLIRDLNSNDQLQKVYNKFVEDKHGFVVRKPRNWSLLLEEHFGEKGYLYLLEKDGQPEGYILYYMQDNKIVVREIAYTNVLAYKALLQFLYNHRSQVEMVEWHSPFDDNIHFLLPEHKKGLEIYPFLMARIVDVMKTLEVIDYPQEIEGEIIIEVEDNLAPWNNQSFLLHVSKGKGSIEALGKDKGDVQITVGALTQLVFGRLEVKELLKLGLIDINILEKLVFFESIFPKCNNYINEYY